MEQSWNMFEGTYRCYPMSMAGRSNPEIGDKILMPCSALDTLLSQPIIEYPMLFQLQNVRTGSVTHCGVLEFTAEEGAIVMPDWMMESMKLEEGDLAVIRYTNLENGTYAKLQPHSVAFLELSNPKVVLETMLRSHSCLTTGDTLMLMHNNKRFYIDVLETKPSHAVSIIETDCEVDFATPLDYKEPEKKKRPVLEKGSDLEQNVREDQGIKFVPFSGKSRSLAGKETSETLVGSTSDDTHSGGLGKKVSSEKLVFGSKSIKPELKESEKLQEEKSSKREEKRFQPFSGKSYRLMD